MFRSCLYSVVFAVAAGWVCSVPAEPPKRGQLAALKTKLVIQHFKDNHFFRRAPDQENWKRVGELFLKRFSHLDFLPAEIKRVRELVGSISEQLNADNLRFPYYLEELLLNYDSNWRIGADSPHRAMILFLDLLAKSYDPHSAVYNSIVAKDPPKGIEIKTVRFQSESLSEPLRVGYVRLKSFYRSKTESSARDVRHALLSLLLSDVEVVVLDLQGNQGGYVDEAIEIGGYFLGEHPIAQESRRYEPARVLYGATEQLYGGALMVLVDSRTASSAELLAAVLQDTNRAILVGDEHTFGKASSQLRKRKDELTLHTTIFRMFRVTGKSFQQTGLTADLVFPTEHSAPQPREQALDYAFVPGTMTPTEFQIYPTPRPMNWLSERHRFRLSQLTDSQKAAGYSREVIRIAADYWLATTGKLDCGDYLTSSQ